MWKRLPMLWTVVRGDVRRLWFAVRHPAAPTWLKAGCGLVVLYLVSPIDLIPDAIPLLGVLDDIVLVPLAMRFLLQRLPAALATEVERRYGQRAG